MTIVLAESDCSNQVATDAASENQATWIRDDNALEINLRSGVEHPITSTSPLDTAKLTMSVNAEAGGAEDDFLESV